MVDTDRVVETPTPDRDELLAEALGSVSALERLLWGWAISRNVKRSGSRLSRMIPKYGVRTATSSVVGNIWLAPAFLGFVATPLLGVHDPTSLDLAVGYLLAAVAVSCIAMGAFRGVGAIVVFRRSKAKTP